MTGKFPVKLILDTHIWLWARLEPQRLSTRLAGALVDRENELWLSAISVGEVIVQLRKKCFDLPQDLPTWVSKTMQDLELTEAPLTVEVALAVFSLKLPHDDPADHFLAATAQTFDLTLVTADRNLVHVPGISVMPN